MECTTLQNWKHRDYIFSLHVVCCFANQHTKHMKIGTWSYPSLIEKSIQCLWSYDLIALYKYVYYYYYYHLVINRLFFIRLVQNRFYAVASVYDISSISVSVSHIKSAVWAKFTDSVTWMWIFMCTCIFLMAETLLCILASYCFSVLAFYILFCTCYLMV